MEKGDVTRAAIAWAIPTGVTWASLADMAAFVSYSLAAAYTLWMLVEKYRKSRGKDAEGE